MAGARRRLGAPDEDGIYAAQDEYRFKFIVIGDAGVGKSCILHQLVENRFRKGLTHTIGVEFGRKSFQFGDKTVNLSIWDTAGQERYRSVTRSYYRGAVGALIVYDITDRESYDHAIHWLADARTLALPGVSIICIGNKSDLRAHRQVTFLEASKFAQENDILFLETSALTGENVEACFVKVVKAVITKMENGLITPGSCVLTSVSEIRSEPPAASGEGRCSC